MRWDLGDEAGDPQASIVSPKPTSPLNAFRKKCIGIMESD
jgi:hypothetical protein